jgi:hypothetical protein
MLIDEELNLKVRGEPWSPTLSPRLGAGGQDGPQAPSWHIFRANAPPQSAETGGNHQPAFGQFPNIRPVVASEKCRRHRCQVFLVHRTIV